jgi:hypothetical protein
MKALSATALRDRKRRKEHTMRRSILCAVFALTSPMMVSGQLATELSDDVRDRYATVSAPAYVIRNVTLVDGTGGPVQRGQSVVVEDGPSRRWAPTSTCLGAPRSWTIRVIR